ncbi:MAG: hypothetical protein WCJ35_17765 [Planctomycetota bacterium]
MLKSVQGVFTNGKVELTELVPEGVSGPVIVTFLPKTRSGMLSELGIDQEQAVDLLLHGRTNESQPAADAWRQTVGMFRDDPIVGEMIEEAERIREEDRRRTRDTTELAVE